MSYIPNTAEEYKRIREFHTRLMDAEEDDLLFEEFVRLSREGLLDEAADWAEDMVEEEENKG